MRIAIVGSRKYPSELAVRQFVNSLPVDTIVVSGGCTTGVDSWAESAALARGLQVTVYKADWAKYGKPAGFLRNGTIVNNSDEVVAFWDLESAGTLHSIKLAKEAGKPLTVFGPPIVPIINKDVSERIEYSLKVSSQ